ncbi:MAG: hypothetical protein ABJN40_12430 [Sneathiella sp.]
MKKYKLLLISCLISLGTAVMLLFWYHGGAPLSSSEIEDYMATIEAQTQKPGARHDFVALREFLDTDDGKPVYTVNLYNFHAVADYPNGSQFEGTGLQAYERFSDVMIPLMIGRGSHPVYGSSWADPTNSQWDRIVIVKYRSRRDLVDLFATDAFAEASLHKWASLRDHQRMIVQAIHLPDGMLVIPLLSLFLGLLVYFVGTLIRRPK